MTESRTPLIVGNWKMNGSLAAVGQWSETFRALWAKDECYVETGLCVPSVYLKPLVDAMAEKPIDGFHAGAEDVSAQPKSGPFTGETSAVMLKDAGALWCIIGHSERRTFYGETDADVAAKAKALVEEGLRPIVCVGETLSERSAGKTAEVVLRQVRAVIETAGIEAVARGAIAYEPLWAIGTGVAASLDQIEPVHKAIRDAVSEVDPEVGAKVRILYGGSVKETNAADIISLPDVDGALVGGASLDAGSFYRICAAVR